MMLTLTLMLDNCDKATLADCSTKLVHHMKMLFSRTLIERRMIITVTCCLENWWRQSGERHHSGLHAERTYEGRPRGIWIQDITDCTSLGINEADRLTQDKQQWRKCVHHVAEAYLTWPDLILNVSIGYNMCSLEMMSLLKQ